MQSLKTYLLEGLIQAALLLSLCGLRVQVGVEPERSLPELGPTVSALPPVLHTHLHNLRNSQEEEGDTSLHPKSPDLDQFFTARRLLGWVRSLDRLQVPQTELEAWLVQQEPPPHPVRLLHGAPHRLAQLQQPQETRTEEMGWEELVEEGEEPVEEVEEPVEDDHLQMDGRPLETSGRHVSPSETHQPRDTDGWGHGGPSEGGQAEDQGSASLQECLHLLENFPLSHDEQGPVCDQGPLRTERGGADAQGPASEVEQHWQDLMDLMEPQSLDVDLLNLLEQESEAPKPPQSEQRPLLDEYMQRDLPRQTRLPRDQELLPLMPSDQLDDPQTTGPVLRDPASLTGPRRLSLLLEDVSSSFLLEEGELLEELLGDTGMLEDMSLLQDEEEDLSAMSLRLQQEGYLDPELTQRTSLLTLSPDGSETSLLSPDRTERSHIPDRRADTSLLTLSPDRTETSHIPDRRADTSLLTLSPDRTETSHILDRRADTSLLTLSPDRTETSHIPDRRADTSLLTLSPDRTETSHIPDRRADTSLLTLSPERRSERSHRKSMQTEDGLPTGPDDAEELDSDSGLSLDSSHSPPSPSDSEASSYSSSSSSLSPLSNIPSPMELEVVVKEEPLDDYEQLGAAGGCSLYPRQDSKHSLFCPEPFPQLHQVIHDHSYNQPLLAPPETSPGRPKRSPRHERLSPISKRLWSRDERRARALRIPFPNELIVNLPVEDFNELLACHRLDEDQLALVRDIRRRGKNKIAAQNCRKRKMDNLVGLERDVSMLRRRRARLLSEKRDALRNLDELRRRASSLYQEVFSALRDAQGRPLDVNEFMLSFESDGGVGIVPRTQDGKGRSRKPHRSKK